MSMIIDFRLRPPYKGFLNTLMWDVPRTERINTRRGYTPTASIRTRSMDALFDEMREAGIDLGVAAGRDPQSVIGGVENEELFALRREYPSSFVAIPSIDATSPHKALQQIDQFAAVEVKAVVVEPGVAPNPMYPSDPSLFDLYERCQARSLAVLIMGGGNAGPDISYSDPIHLDRIAARFPDLRIVATHGGWPFVQQIVGVAFRRPNVYVCPDMYLLNSPGCSDYVAAMNSYMQDQFVFATSYPFSPLKEYVDGFMALPLRTQVLEKVLRQNAMNVLRLAK